MNKSQKNKIAAEMLKAIAHPIRISIVELLANSGQMNVTEIFNALDIKQAIASHQLNTLKNRGVLNSEREGKKTYYSIKHPNIITAVNLLLKI
ncbi:MAG: metalloregulator ArsR/SmtB family transcription factor [Flavobacteriales bacterium]|nr:metalloregulator ArsR/SmtB family transcription factor [Flavobacteriales bacterium]